jgi:chromosome segregation ATPase
LKPTKLSRSARDLSYNTEHMNKMKSDTYPNKDLTSTAVELKRTKRQRFLFNEEITKDIAEIKQRLDGIEAIIDSHINGTNNDTTFNFTNSNDVLAVSKKLNETREKQVELEEKLKDLETRLEVTELTTAEIVEEMERTRSYLEHLKANMSSTVDETPSNNTVVVTTDDGKEQLPPSKDLKAFQNYLKDIGEITREDFQELGNQKEDFIASCTWQGTICDSR